MELLAYHGKTQTKKKYVSRMKAHIEADELIRGTGWDGKRGCAVGCTLNAYDHGCYQNELGLPEWVAKLEDSLFEGMSQEKSKTFPLFLLESIPVGFKAYDKVLHKFCIYVLEDSKKNVKEQFAYVIKAIDVVIDYHLKSIVGFESETAAKSAAESAESAAWSAWSAARSAESAAWSAAESAAKSAAWSAAESAAKSAAWSAAESAKSAAWSAAESAWSAAWSAWSAARSAESAAKSAAKSAAWSAAWSAAESAAWSAAESAESAAESAAYDRYADKLMELFKET